MDALAPTGPAPTGARSPLRPAPGVAGRGRLDGLDALRGIAALLVVGHHYLRDPHGAAGLFRQAYLAVDFFFLLSGYVMARTYEARLADGRLDARAFLVIRVRRLWPAILVAAAVALLAADLLPPEIFASLLVAQLLCVPLPVYARLFPLNGPQWSLAFELFANLVHALGLARLGNRALGLGVGVAGLWLALAARQAGTVSMGDVPASIWGGVPRILFSYGLGILLYRQWRDRPPRRLPAGLAIVLMPFAFALCDLAPGPRWLIDLAFVAFASPLLLAGGLTLDAGRVGRGLGAMSYPLYAVHGAVLLVCVHRGWSSAAALALLVGATALAQWAGRFAAQPTGVAGRKPA